ncbi:MAG: PLP-dependent transferase, partial [Sphingosinicella sp.]
LGQTAGPDEAWLALRGLRTLGLRLERHQQNGLKVARWLAGQPQVARVLHPALETCPGHENWARDYTGATGLFSIVLAGGDAASAARFVESLQLFAIGYSWGGFESLAVPAEITRTVSARTWEGPLIRLHVGLEEPDELIADLAAALARWTP